MRLLSLLVLLLIPSITIADTCVRKNSLGAPEYYYCETKMNFKYDIRTTKVNGRVIKKVIVPESVCRKYKKGSILRRQCIRDAKDAFAEKCGDSQLAEIDHRMYCDAERIMKFHR